MRGVSKITKKYFLMSIFWKYKKRYLFSFFLIISSAIAISFMPQIINYIFDDAITNNDMHLLLLCMVAYVLIAALYNIIDMTNSNLFTKTGAMAIKDIREKLCVNISKKNGEYYTKLKTGDISNRILAEVEFVESFITQNLFTILSDIFMFFIVGSVLFKINSVMMIILLLIQPLIIIIQNKFGKKSAKLTRKFRETYQDMCSATTEFLNNIMNIIFSNATDYYFKNYNKLQDRVIVDALECQKNGNKSYFFQDILSNITIIVVIGYGGYAVINGNLTIGELIAFNMYSSKIFGSVNRLSKSYIKFKQFDIYVERLVEIINNSNVKNRDNPFVFNESIKFDNVSFNYDTKRILTDITLQVNKGQRVAIVGESGSGKSTLINLLYALWDCKEGKILIDNMHIEEINIKDLRDKIAIISQNAFFYSDTIYNNLVLDKGASKEEVDYVCKVACIHDFIMTLPEQYNTIIQEDGKNLSGGQRQRLSIARGLLNKVEIFCLDEPTSAIDNITARDMEEKLLAILEGKTVLTITHKIESTKSYDMIYLIDNGRVLEKGSFDSLINNSNGKFYSMYEKEKI